MKRFLFAALIVLGCSSGAHAQWLTQVEDDVLTDGKTATLTGMISFQQAIYIKCSSEGELTLAYIEKGDWTDGMSLVPVKLVFKIDDKEKVWLDASGYQHNSLFIGFKNSDGDLIRAVLKDLSTGRSKLLFGMKSDLVDINMSGSMGLDGSTKATERFAQACKLNLKEVQEKD
jgi:hypothetical protein